MKILYSIGSLKGLGGTERVLLTKAKYFSEIFGYEIHIATNDSAENISFSIPSGIHIHPLGKTISEFRHSIPFITNYQIKKSLYHNYRKLISSIQPDLVIVMERGTDDFYLPDICHSLNIPVAREFHFAKEAVYERAKLFPFSTKVKFLFNYQRIFRAFNNYDYLVLLTKMDQQSGNYKSQTVVIPNMIEPLNDHLCANYDNKTIISVGSMNDRRKGFDTLIQIWSELAPIYPDWKVKIYGTGPEFNNLKVLIKGLGLNNSVFLCGATKDIERAYLDSSFYISCSCAEGLPMVLLEAMSYGLPCIAYDCPTGPRDIISDEVDGKLVPLHDKEKMKAAICSFIENSSNLPSMGRKAKDKAKMFEPQAILPLWKNFFESVKIKNG